MAQQDYYDLLGVSKSANKNEIKRAYKKLAMKYHPDKNKDNPEAEKKFKEIAQAYSILSDDQKRAQYDQFGHAGFEGGAGGGQGFNDFADIFKDFFGGDFADAFQGGGRRQQRTRAQNGDDLLYELTLTLEEVASGCEKTIRIPNTVTCDPCHGSGAKSGSKPQTCQTCHGQGQVRIQQGFMAIQQPCPTCRGQGEIIKDPCHHCRGQGRVRKQCQYRIKVPKGIDNGNRIRLSEKGEAGIHGGQNGDLYVAISLEKHKLFERIDQNLHLEVFIDFPTAALGGTVDIPSIEGDSITLKIPPETHCKQVLRLKGKGLPAFNRKPQGDLMCHIYVETPSSLNDKQKALLQELKQSLSESQQSKCSSWLNTIKKFIMG
ncbi:MAG: molecular chaperone DnaJ [Candidatus Comchoanobacterales bacterium]